MDEPILVVDDDVSINNLLCEAFSGAGYRPQSAYSGSEAILSLGVKPWKCVILDLMLPGRSREEGLSALRKKENMRLIVLPAKTGKGGMS